MKSVKEEEERYVIVSPRGNVPNQINKRKLEMFKDVLHGYILDIYLL